MIILGITAPLSWNSAAAIIKDKKLVAAVEEERFNGLKHSPRIIPVKSIEYCLSAARVKASDVDAIAIGYRHPISYYGRSLCCNIIEGNFNRAIREFGAFSEYYTGLIRLYDWLKLKGFNFEGSRKLKISFIPHHLAHAASSFRCSGFREANIITIDGQGEDDSGSLWIGRNSRLERINKIGINQSLGMVYGEATDILGFKPHSHEGKVMGLAGWGKKKINTKDLWQITSQGYELLPKWQKNFWDKYGPRRERAETLTDKHRNLALSVQNFTEKAGQSLAKSLH
ncbi:MAG: carbamoyltransferase N-terminal domain-containing protein [Patescibacteria group bacterium]|jgi:carbamoyltransferase